MSTKQIEKNAKVVLVDTRCLYVSATGRRCRSLAARDTSRPSGLSAFCIPHSQLEQQYVNIKSFSEELLGDTDNFQTAISVNQVLGNYSSFKPKIAFLSATRWLSPTPRR